MYDYSIAADYFQNPASRFGIENRLMVNVFAFAIRLGLHFSPGDTGRFEKNGSKNYSGHYGGRSSVTGSSGCFADGGNRFGPGSPG